MNYLVIRNGRDNYKPSTTIARNDCRVSKDDVALALNHVDEGNRVTDIYIAKDWRIVDEVQDKVLKKLKEKEVECRDDIVSTQS